jgi:hypothetical protein
MHRVLMTGHAESQSGAFDFKIGEWAGGIGLMMRDTGSGDSAFNGAGIRPNIEEAKLIADQSAKRLIGPECAILWTKISN